MSGDGGSKWVRNVAACKDIWQSLRPICVPICERHANLFAHSLLSGMSVEALYKCAAVAMAELIRHHVRREEDVPLAVELQRRSGE
jgi:hypothetical protein